MKKPHNWDDLIRSSVSLESTKAPYHYLVAYYLSKYDENAYNKLGFGNKSKTHQKLSDILKSCAPTIKNYRDCYDKYLPNPRQGWDLKLTGFQKKIFDGFEIAGYSEEEVYMLVQKILATPNLDFKNLFDSFDTPDNVSIFPDKIGNLETIKTLKEGAICQVQVNTYERSLEARKFDSFDRPDNVSIFPDEIGNLETIKTLKEGAICQVQVNAYERSLEARKQCITHYGLTCSVCSFNFEKFFGEVGKGFIHVHHLTPLSEINQEYEVDPIKDLRPVCPNCHAMIHRRSPPLSIQETKNLIQFPENNYLE